MWLYVERTFMEVAELAMKAPYCSCGWEEITRDSIITKPSQRPKCSNGISDDLYWKSSRHQAVYSPTKL